MPLRARLALLVAALLTGSVAVLGGGTLWWTRSSLVHEADARLLRARAEPQPSGPTAADPAERAGHPVRRVALLRFDARGRLEEAKPSELTGDPDPLPAVSWETALSAARTGRIAEAESADGALEYHWTAGHRPDGGATVFAVSLGEVEQTTDLLLWSLALGGGAVAAIGGGVGWWMMRRELRPLDDLVDATEAVAAGDLTRRIEPRSARDEVGRLTAGFDLGLHREGARPGRALLAGRRLQREHQGRLPDHHFQERADPAGHRHLPDRAVRPRLPVRHQPQRHRAGDGRVHAAAQPDWG
ncbi:HAMP domain-containing protein [Streptomyces sp. NPDC019396]|uniref:HAMP domain-containing protein n=1 Tax=Streptomyces sp. NPDC019396 TaxID=3154687 RepID=UPI00340284E6